jgi:RNA-binding protein
VRLLFCGMRRSEVLGLRVLLLGEGTDLLLLDEPWEGLDPEGSAWLTDTVRQTVDDDLRTHELVKIQFTKNADADVKGAANDLAAKLSADVVQVIGRTATLYRANPELPRKEGRQPWQRWDRSSATSRPRRWRFRLRSRPGPGHEVRLGHFNTPCRATVRRSSTVPSRCCTRSSSVNHRAFNAVFAADSNCAMAQWGIALSRWETMAAYLRSAEKLKGGRQAVDVAMRVAPRATDREREYVRAVSQLTTTSSTRTRPSA